MSKVMMLAKNYDPKHVVFPVWIEEKLDGVPADFFVAEDGQVRARSRQGKTVFSVDHIREELQKVMQPGMHFIGELYTDGQKFKDIGGNVRREEINEALSLNIFDYYFEGREQDAYGIRMDEAASIISRIKQKKQVIQFFVAFQALDVDTLEEYAKEFMANKPEAEGVIIRSLAGPMEIGKRSWNFQRIKREETVDLKLIGFEPAIDAKTKQPNGMAGRLWVYYKGEESGAGPGALDHKTRKDMMQNPEKYIGRIIEVAYKPDDSYDGLREGRFVKFRDDKTEPNEE